MTFIVAEQLFNTQGEFVGVKRMVVEYWEPGSDTWTFNKPDYDKDRSRKLSDLPRGTAGLPRKRTRIRE